MNTPSPDNTEPKVTRRQFLQDAVTLAGSVLTGYVGTTIARDSLFPPAVEAQITEATIEKPAQKSISTEEKLFANYSAEEKIEIEKNIINQIELYQNDTERAERVLDWEKSTLQPILDLDVPASDHLFWKEFMSAVVYVESEGKTSALSEVGIVGLAQISQATAQETAKKHGIISFDLRKGWDSLRLSRFHFQDLMEKYGPDISLLAYYAGQGFTDQKISAASEKNRVNIANLGSADGIEYLSKVVAAHRILTEARKN